MEVTGQHGLCYLLLQQVWHSRGRRSGGVERARGGMADKGVRHFYILHELSADWSDIFTQGGAEHHDLLLMGSHTENLLDISAHV